MCNRIDFQMFQNLEAVTLSDLFKTYEHKIVRWVHDQVGDNPIISKEDAVVLLSDCSYINFLNAQLHRSYVEFIDVCQKVYGLTELQAKRAWVTVLTTCTVCDDDGDSFDVVIELPKPKLIITIERIDKIIDSTIDGWDLNMIPLTVNHSLK